MLQEIPQTPMQLYWAIIVALSSAVGVLFWQLQKARDKQIEIIQSFILPTGSALAELAKAVKALEEGLRLHDDIQELLRRKERK